MLLLAYWVLIISISNIVLILAICLFLRLLCLLCLLTLDLFSSLVTDARFYIHKQHI